MDFKKEQAILPKNYLERLFSGSETFEMKYSLDIANWSTPMIIEFYKTKRTPSLQSLIIMNARLSEYADYLLRLKTAGISKNNFSNISTDSLRTCVDSDAAKKRYLSFNQFKKDINCLDNYVDRFVLYALFEGIKGKGFEDIWRLQLKDISKSECILHNGKKIDLMSSDLYHLANNSANTYKYYSYGKTDVVFDMYGEPDQIIKMTNKKQYMLVNDDPVMIDRQNRNIFRKFERVASAVGWELIKPRTLLISGQIEYAKRMTEEHNIDIIQLLYNKTLFNKLQKRFIKIASKDDFMEAYQYVNS